MKQFYSHGKLLLTSEYFILDGAKAIAFPCKKGQSFSVKEEIGSGVLHYRAKDQNQTTWFSCEIDWAQKRVLNTNDINVGRVFLKVLKTCQNLNPDFLDLTKNYVLESLVEFNLNWGLGSSSTFINNLAQWASVNPYDLNQEIFGGSSYDIACASARQPIFYQLKHRNSFIKEIDLKWGFLNDLYFVHLNQKQNSREGIQLYKQKSKSSKQIDFFTQLSDDLLKCKSLFDFESLIHLHEKKVSSILEIPTVKSKLFPDYDGQIKSLGAWGGDFALVTKRDEMKSYFNKKGFETIIPYRDMVL